MIFWYIIAVIISIPLSGFLISKCYYVYAEATRRSTKKEIELEVSCFICKKHDLTLLGRGSGLCFHEACLQNVLNNPHDFSTVILIRSVEVLKYLNDIATARRNALDEISNKFNEFQFQKTFIGDKSASDFLKELSYFSNKKPGKDSLFKFLRRSPAILEDQSPGEGASSSW